MTKKFTYLRTTITYAVLTSYLMLSIGQSYAMEGRDYADISQEERGRSSVMNNILVSKDGGFEPLSSRSDVNSANTVPAKLTLRDAERRQFGSDKTIKSNLSTDNQHAREVIRSKRAQSESNVLQNLRISPDTVTEKLTPILPHKSVSRKNSAVVVSHENSGVVLNSITEEQNRDNKINSLNDNSDFEITLPPIKNHKSFEITGLNSDREGKKIEDDLSCELQQYHANLGDTVSIPPPPSSSVSPLSFSASPTFSFVNTNAFVAGPYVVVQNEKQDKQYDPESGNLTLVLRDNSPLTVSVAGQEEKNNQEPTVPTLVVGDVVVPDYKARLYKGLSLITSIDPKVASSATISLLATAGLYVLADKLGSQVSPGMGYTLGVSGLIANALMYHKCITGLTYKDLPLEVNGTAWEKTQIYSAELYKLNIAMISSFPLAFASWFVTKDISSGLAITTGVFSLACTIPLYQKSQTAFVDFIKGLIKLYNVSEERKENVWFYKKRVDEVGALSRDEVHALYAEFQELNSDYPEGIPDREFKKLMLELMPSELDTSERFWSNEGVGAVFGLGLAGIFGGMYLFEVSLPLYIASLETFFGGVLSPAQIYALSYAGSVAILFGQAPLQIKSGYDVFKIFSTKSRRSYETRFLKKNPLVLASSTNIEDGSLMFDKRKITYAQAFQEYVSDSLDLVLAGGASATRAEICITFMKNPSLLVLVIAGSAVAFFSIFYFFIHSYFESFTETGVKRGKLRAAVQAKLNAAF